MILVSRTRNSKCERGDGTPERRKVSTGRRQRRIGHALGCHAKADPLERDNRFAAGNVQILCARHRFRTRDRVQHTAARPRSAAQATGEPRQPRAVSCEPRHDGTAMTGPAVLSTEQHASFWVATAMLAPECSPLCATVDADVCVIGGGYTGLACVRAVDHCRKQVNSPPIRRDHRPNHAAHQRVAEVQRYGAVHALSAALVEPQRHRQIG